MMSSMLAYLPFIDPLNLHHQPYWLLIPLAFGISVIYKAMRMQSLEGFWRQAVVMTAQIVVAMIGLAVALTVLIQLVIPILPVE